MNADHVEFDTKKFSPHWNIPKDLRGQIFVAGVSHDGSEIYYSLNFNERVVDYCKVKTSSYRSAFARYLSDNLSVQDLPYGVTSHESLTSEFMYPHEGLKFRSNGNIAVAMHNVGFIRIINFEDRFVSNYPEGKDFRPIMISATNNLSDDQSRYYYSISSMDHRLRQCHDRETLVPTEVVSCDHNFTDHRSICHMEVREPFHEVKITPSNEKLILTEAAMVTPCKPPVDQAGLFENPDLWTDYKSSGLYTTNLSMVDIESSHISSLAFDKTPGHIEFSLTNPDEFYLSCHNLSRAYGKMILHGPGSLTKIRIDGQKLIVKNSYQDNQFFRITSHKVIRYKSRSYIVVTAYPNKLYVLEDGSMDLVKVVELFPHSPIVRDSLHFSNSYSYLPLWIESSNCNRYIIMASNSYCHFYDLEKDELSGIAGYSFNNDLIGTAHLTNLDCRN
jgi:hypothetical protein